MSQVRVFPNPRCRPTRRDPLFGGWLVLDTLTGILLNTFGPWTAKGNCNEEMITRREAEAAAEMWNRLLAGHPRRLHPRYRAYRATETAKAVAA